MRSIILAGALITLGIVIGAYVVTQRNQTTGSEALTAGAPPVQPPNRAGSTPASGLSAISPTPVLEIPASEIPDRFANAMVELEEQVSFLTSDRDRVQRELAELWQRLTMLEKDTLNDVDSGSNDADADPHAGMPIRTSQQRHNALMAAGLSLSEADRILQHESELELAQLELRDRAIREDWVRSQRYRDERRVLYQREIDLRAEVGDQVYDHYLFIAGKPNRIKVQSVIKGSMAESAGIVSGDVIHSFDGARVFTAGEMQSLNTAGARHELVRVSVLRNGHLVETMVPRGPLGMQLDRVREDPDR